MTEIMIDVEIEPGLRYAEETGRASRGLPARDCFLWKEGVEEPISGVNLVSFRQRFGAVSIACEGIGGVETLPQFRRQGYIRKLLKQALAGISKRVKVAFLDGIEDVYDKFGFVTCIAESHLSLPIRYVERIDGRNNSGRSGQLRRFTSNDLPAMIDLYNREHAFRSGTHDRQAGWNRLVKTETWQPGSKVIIFEREEGLAGYAIVTEQRFGSPSSSFVVDELTANDVASAQVLLVELAVRCWQMRISEFKVHEPLDSTVGRTAQGAGCSCHQSFSPSGGMMGRILERPGLLQLLEPELLRRLPGNNLQAAHPAVFTALCQGEIIPDNGSLLRLLMGFWSLPDALARGVMIPAEYRQVCQAWFPGGNTEKLPLPYAHQLDRY